jgi:hypothetical protein
LTVSHEDIVRQLRALVCESLRQRAAGTLSLGGAQLIQSLTRSAATVLKLDREVRGKRIGVASTERAHRPTTRWPS